MAARAQAVMSGGSYHYTIPMQSSGQDEGHSNVVMMDIPLDLKMFMDARNVNVSNSSEVSKLHPGQILTTAQLHAASVATITDPGSDGIISSDSGDHSRRSPPDEDLASSSTSVHISDLPPSTQHHHQQHHLAPSAIISAVPDIHDSSSPSPHSDEGHDNDPHHHSHTLTDLSSSAPSHPSLLHAGALSHHQHISQDSSPEDNHQQHHLTHLQQQHIVTVASDVSALSLQQHPQPEAGSNSQPQGLYQPVYSVTAATMAGSTVREVYQEARGHSSPSLYSLSSSSSSSSSSAIPLTVLQTMSSTTNNNNNISSTIAPSYLTSTQSKLDNSSQDIVYSSMTSASIDSQIDSENDTVMTSGGSYQIIATSLPYTVQDVNGRALNSPIQSFVGSVATSHNSNVIHNPSSLSTHSHNPGSGLVSNVVSGGNIIVSSAIGSNNIFSSSSNSNSHHGSVVSSTTGTTQNSQHHPPVTLGANTKSPLSASTVAALDVPSSQLYRCYDCSSGFKSKKPFDNHMMKFHGVNISPASSVNGGTSGPSVSTVTSNISSQNITANREGDNQIMVMLHPSSYSPSSSYSSSTSHASSHQHPIIAQHLHQPQQPISNSHTTQQQSGVLQQIVLEPTAERDGAPNSSASRSNANNRTRSYHDTGSGDQNQSSPSGQQQVYTLQQAGGQYTSDQLSRDGGNNIVSIGGSVSHDGRSNNVVITVPRSSISYGTDTTSSTRTVIASNNAEYQILTHQPQQQQNFKNRGPLSATQTASSVSDSSIVVYQHGKSVTSASCDSSNFTSQDNIGNRGGETYVVAATDLHQLQQSGGQLLLPASNQQHQELQTRFSNQQQVSSENANNQHQSQQILVPVSRINNQQQIQQQDSLTQAVCVDQEQNQIHQQLQQNRNIQHQINPVQHQIQQQQAQEQHQHLQGGRTQIVASQAGGNIFYDPAGKKITKDELIVPNACHTSEERYTYTKVRSILSSPEKGASRNNRPFKCNKCTASFIDAMECEEHKRKHSGDGPFTCEDCHFSFMYKSHFKSHKTRCMKKRASMAVAQLTVAANAGIPKPLIVPPSGIKREFPTHQTVQVTGGTTARGGHGRKRGLSGEPAKVAASRQYSSSNAQATEVYCTTTVDDPLYSPHQQYPGGSGGSNNQHAAVDYNEGLTGFNNNTGINVSSVGVGGNHYFSSANSRVTVNKGGEGGGHQSHHKRIINPVNVKPEAELIMFNPVNPSFKRLKRQNNDMRPHECDECDASFTTEEDLTHHKQKHSGDGPFRCDSCQFVYLYRRLYDAHKRKCKKGKSKRDGPIGSGIATGEQSHNSAAAAAAAATTVVVPASVGDPVTSSGGDSGAEAAQQEQQQHVQFVQQHIQQQMQQLQQQQQQLGVSSTNSSVVQQQQPQIIFIDQQQHSKLNQQQQIDLSGLTQQGGVITLPQGQQTLPQGQQQNATNANTAHQQQQQQQFQIVGPGGVQVLDTGTILELRGQQLVAVSGAGIGSGDVKYEIVQALDMDNVAQLMNLIKKGTVVSSAQ